MGFISSSNPGKLFNTKSRWNLEGVVLPKIAGLCAVTLSVISFVCCAMFISILMSKVSEIKTELSSGSEEFRMLSDKAWPMILQKKQANSNNRRVSRQAQLCACDAFNSCSEGPSGPVGDPGLDGDPGSRGATGEKGLPGVHSGFDNFFSSDTSCRQCPPGPRGNLGVPGPKGLPGSRGSPGPAGLTGQPGQKGPDGPKGHPGTPGPTGYSGPAGDSGKSGNRGQKGPLGPKGPRGPRGEKGVPGWSPTKGNDGLPGNAGAPGPTGSPGEKGWLGTMGHNGVPGPPGEDAQYCPCPVPSDNVASARNEFETAKVTEEDHYTSVAAKPNDRAIGNVEASKDLFRQEYSPSETVKITEEDPYKSVTTKPNDRTLENLETSEDRLKYSAPTKEFSPFGGGRKQPPVERKEPQEESIPSRPVINGGPFEHLGIKTTEEDLKKWLGTEKPVRSEYSNPVENLGWFVDRGQEEPTAAKDQSNQKNRVSAITNGPLSHKNLGAFEEDIERIDLVAKPADKVGAERSGASEDSVKFQLGGKYDSSENVGQVELTNERGPLNRAKVPYRGGVPQWPVIHSQWLETDDDKTTEEYPSKAVTTKPVDSSLENVRTSKDVLVFKLGNASAMGDSGQSVNEDRKLFPWPMASPSKTAKAKQQPSITGKGVPPWPVIHSQWLAAYDDKTSEESPSKATKPVDSSLGNVGASKEDVVVFKLGNASAVEDFGQPGNEDQKLSSRLTGSKTKNEVTGHSATIGDRTAEENFIEHVALARFVDTSVDTPSTQTDFVASQLGNYGSAGNFDQFENEDRLGLPAPISPSQAKKEQRIPRWLDVHCKWLETLGGKTTGNEEFDQQIVAKLSDKSSQVTQGSEHVPAFQQGNSSTAQNVGQIDLGPTRSVDIKGHSGPAETTPTPPAIGSQLYANLEGIKVQEDLNKEGVAANPIEKEDSNTVVSDKHFEPEEKIDKHISTKLSDKSSQMTQGSEQVPAFQQENLSTAQNVGQIDLSSTIRVDLKGHSGPAGTSPTPPAIGSQLYANLESTTVQEDLNKENVSTNPIENEDSYTVILDKHSEQEEEFDKQISAKLSDKSSQITQGSEQVPAFQQENLNTAQNVGKFDSVSTRSVDIKGHSGPAGTTPTPPAIGSQLYANLETTTVQEDLNKENVSTNPIENEDSYTVISDKHSEQEEEFDKQISAKLSDKSSQITQGSEQVPTFQQENLSTAQNVGKFDLGPTRSVDVKRQSGPAGTTPTLFAIGSQLYANLETITVQEDLKQEGVAVNPIEKEDSYTVVSDKHFEPEEELDKHILAKLSDKSSQMTQGSEHVPAFQQENLSTAQNVGHFDFSSTISVDLKGNSEPTGTAHPLAIGSELHPKLETITVQEDLNKEGVTTNPIENEDSYAVISDKHSEQDEEIDKHILAKLSDKSLEMIQGSKDKHLEKVGAKEDSYTTVAPDEHSANPSSFHFGEYALGKWFGINVQKRKQ